MEYFLIQKMEKDISPIVFIIEGVDCSGKSYLIDGLCKKYPSIVIKNTMCPTKKDKNQIREYKRYILSILSFVNHNRFNKTMILDRFFPSEIAYSLVKRKYDAFLDRDYKEMEKSLASLNHLYIYCNPGLEVLNKRFKKRGDEHIVLKDIKNLSKRYDRFFRQTIMNKLELDTSKPIHKLLEIIEDKIK